MDKYIKAIFDLKTSYGKKLVNVLYYASIIIAAGNLIYNLMNSVFVIAAGGAQVFAGFWSFITAPILFVFYLIIIRVVCEVLNVFFDRNISEDDERE